MHGYRNYLCSICASYIISFACSSNVSSRASKSMLLYDNDVHNWSLDTYINHEILKSLIKKIQMHLMAITPLTLISFLWLLEST